MHENTAEKLNRIQSLFDAGKSHAEIAKELGYSNIKSFYRYIYRYNDSLHYTKLFDKKSLSVVPQWEPQTKQVEKAVEVKTKSKENMSKAESIVSLIDSGMDIREVAVKKNFKSIQELADYMKSKGYNWNSKAKNYILVTQVKVVKNLYDSQQIQMENEEHENIESALHFEQYSDLLMFLVKNKTRLEELLCSGIAQGQIPRFIIPGNVKTKSIKIVNTLESLMNEFCDISNITQKEMLEVAIIDCLKKYGYQERVRRIIGI